MTTIELRNGGFVCDSGELEHGREKGEMDGSGWGFIGGQRRRKKEGSGRVGLLPCVGDGGRMPCMAAPLTGREKEGGARGRKGMRRGRKERVLTGGARSAVRERGRARAGV